MPYHFAPSPIEQAVLSNASLFQRCTSCKMLRDKWSLPFDLTAPPEGSPHVSQTADGLYLASPAFYRRYCSEGWSGLSFRPLSCGYFDMRPERRVEILQERQSAHLLHSVPRDIPERRRDHAMIVHDVAQCDVCGKARHVRALGPMVIARGELPVASMEFVGTYLEFGPADARHYRLIAGEGIRGAHRKTRIRGARFGEPVFYAPWGNCARAHEGPGQVISIRAYREAQAQRVKA